MGYSLLQQKTGFVLLPEREGSRTTDYVALVDRNGLIQVVQRPKARSHFAAPFKLLLLFAVLLTVFKSLALLNVGVIDYEDELAALQNGNLFEQAGAFVLQIDPLTETLKHQLAPLLR